MDFKGPQPSLVFLIMTLGLTLFNIELTLAHSLKVKTADQRIFDCTLSHTQNDDDQPGTDRPLKEKEKEKEKYYLCDSPEGLMILSNKHNSWTKNIWIGYEKRKDHHLPKKVSIISIEDETGPYQLSNNYSGNSGAISSRSLKERINELSPFLEDLKRNFDWENKERKIGLAVFEKLLADFIHSTEDEFNSIQNKLTNLDFLTVELVNGPTVECKSKNSYAPLNKNKDGCQFFFICPSVTINGQTYEGLLFYSPFDVGRMIPSLTLSRKGELGPLLKVASTYAGPKDDKNLIEKTLAKEDETKKFNFPPQLAGQENALNYHIMGNGNMWGESRKISRELCQESEVQRLFRQEDEGLQKAKDILAKAELVQILLTFQAKTESWLLPKNSLPTCPILNKPGMVAPIVIEEAKGSQPPIPNDFKGALSLDEAQKVFQELSEMEDIPYCALDGCHARAHVMAHRLEQKGIQTEKVWARGELVPEAFKQIIPYWRIHVAPSIFVKNEKGQITRMVFDPSLAKSPLSVEDWASLFPNTGNGPLTYLNSHFAQDEDKIFQRTLINITPSSIYLFNSNLSKENALLQAHKENARNKMDEYSKK